MTGEDDQNLIRQYANHQSEEAFTKLAHRHVDLAYSTAFRILRNSSLAEDVTQRVFIILAQNATKLQLRTSLAGWVHQTARNTAISLIRNEERRRLREQEAVTMKVFDSNDKNALWDEVAPQLDEALTRLSNTDRDLILWRFFERRTAGQIGALLGLAPEAAQKRVMRALERLRRTFAECGLKTTAVGLASLLSAQAIQSTPAGLAAAALTAAQTTASLGPATSIIGILMTSLKAKIGLTTVLVVGIASPLVLQHHQNAQLHQEVAMLRQQISELNRLREQSEKFAIDSQVKVEAGQPDPAELARLRSELTALKAKVVEPVGSNHQVNKGVSSSNPNLANSPKVDPFLNAENWANVGFATPSAAFQTLQWAKANGDTNLLANSLAWLDEASRKRIESIFASAPTTIRSQYGSADAFVISFFYGPPSGDIVPVVGYRIVSEQITGDDAMLECEFQFPNGQTKTEPRLFVRIGDEWREGLDLADRAIDRLTVRLGLEPSLAGQQSGGE